MNKSAKFILLAAVAAAVPAIAGAATAQELWTKDCAKCHGADGSASGPMGKKLKIKDYTNAEVNAAMTDEEITKAIKEGETNDAGKKVMPAYGEKYSDDEVASLVTLIRGFAPAAP